MVLQSFLAGLISLVTPGPFVLLLLSFVLLPRLSNSFRKHLLKVIVICATIFAFYTSAVLTGMVGMITVMQGLMWVILALVICFLLWLINSFQTLSSYKMSEGADKTATWVGAIVLGYLFYAATYMCAGPILGMLMIYGMNDPEAPSILWASLIFVTGFMLPFLAVILLSWLVFGRNRDKKWVSIVQGIFTVIAVIAFLRLITGMISMSSI